MNILDLAGATEKRDAAYELKFVVSTPVADSALAWARQNLAPDPHVDASGGDGYHVNSLYFDTPALDVYQRNGSYGKAKYRVRRYGAESTVFLERKLKSRGLVSKRRTRIPDDDIFLLASDDPLPDWIGYWFRRRLLARQLLPQCQIRYQRVARVGMTPQGPIRFTLDRDVRGFQTKQYRVLEHASWVALLPDQCIMELKFRLEIPSLFMSLIEQLGLTPQPVSKYRLNVQVAGLQPSPVPSPTALVQPVAGNGDIATDALTRNHHPVIIQPVQSRLEA
jgi:hypothetical protein